MDHTLGVALGEKDIVGGPEQVSDLVVKSAGRVLTILELFDVLRRPASISEICQLLNFPQSSTSVLLRSMVELGYVSYNRETRFYHPTIKVALLGNWINAPLVGDGALLRLMYGLNQKTGQTIVLAVRNHLDVEYIHILQGQDVARRYVAKGLRRSIVKSSAGFMMLADLPDAEIKRIALRANSETRRPESMISLNWLMTQIETVRRDGYALSIGLVTPGGGMLSMKLPELPESQCLVIGIGALNGVLQQRKDEFLAAMKEVIAIYLSEKSMVHEN